MNQSRVPATLHQNWKISRSSTSGGLTSKKQGGRGKRRSPRTELLQIAWITEQLASLLEDRTILANPDYFQRNIFKGFESLPWWPLLCSTLSPFHFQVFPEIWQVNYNFVGAELYFLFFLFFFFCRTWYNLNHNWSTLSSGWWVGHETLEPSSSETRNVAVGLWDYIKRHRKDKPPSLPSFEPALVPGLATRSGDSLAQSSVIKLPQSSQTIAVAAHFRCHHFTFRFTDLWYRQILANSSFQILLAPKLYEAP